MNLEQVQPIVNAVLYEGYILYPYTPTSAKNRQRWTFGGIYPEVYFAVSGGADPCHMQTQCLVEGGANSLLQVRVKFLQPIARDVGVLDCALASWPEDCEPAFQRVPSLTLGGRQFHSWQEAVERDVAVVDCPLGELLGQRKEVPFVFGGGSDIEPLQDEDGVFKGILLYRRIALQGRVAVSLESIADDMFRLTVKISNTTDMDPVSVENREQASLYSFASTHTILGVEQGAFVSLMDPPAALEEAVAACDNQGAFPVLIGKPGTRDTLLSSPIILYDYPEVAPESPGEFFDSTEIDEILSLRILTMTDAEKRQMTAADPRGAALLARTEALDSDDFMRMHGTLRDPQRSAGSANNPLEAELCGPRLVFYRNGDTVLKVGDRVRLRPKAGGDVWDIVLDGKTALIEGIERDFEDMVHVAVTIEDDPGREWGDQRMPGHRFFFSPQELEPVASTLAQEVQA